MTSVKETKKSVPPSKRRGLTLQELEAYRQNNLKQFWGVTDKQQLEKSSLLIKD